MWNIWKILGGSLVACLLIAGTPAVAQNSAEPPAPHGRVSDLKITDQDYAMGDPAAKVVLVEYASLTCPHCAAFHAQILPGLKKEFIDTGKVRYIYRDFPLDRLALGAAMVARCSGRESFFGFIDTFYAAQSQWSGASNPVAALANLAKLGGMNGKAFEACLQNAEVQNEVLKQRLEGSRDYKVEATPTVFVNGDRYSGGMTLEQFRTLLNRLLSDS